MHYTHEYMLCRLCLCGGARFIDIFEEKDEQEFVVENVIQHLLQIEVVKETGCPWLVCSTCLAKLTEYRLFQRHCIECQTAFENRVNRGKFPKARVQEIEQQKVANLIGDEESVQINQIEDGLSVQSKSGDPLESSGEINDEPQEHELQSRVGFPPLVLMMKESYGNHVTNVDEVKALRIGYVKNCEALESNGLDTQGETGSSATRQHTSKESLSATNELENTVTSLHECTDVEPFMSNSVESQKRKNVICAIETLSSYGTNGDRPPEILVLRKAARLDLGMSHNAGGISLSKNASSGSSAKKVLKMYELTENSMCAQVNRKSTPQQTDRAVQTVDGSDKLVMMDVLASIKEEVGELKGMLTGQFAEEKDALRTISSKLDGQVRERLECSLANEKLKNLHSFPIEEIENLLELEDTLATNDKYRRYLICFLKDRSKGISYNTGMEKQLSISLNKTVNDMCVAIISNELAVNFCMKGRSESKIAFELHFRNVIDVIFESVKAKAFPLLSIDLNCIKKSMSEWFRLSRHRTAQGKLARKLSQEKGQK